MGNWRTVNISGHISTDEASDIRRLLKGMEFDDEAQAPYSLDAFRMTESVCGIGEWVSPLGEIQVCGNLSERDYDNDDIEEALKFLAAKYKSLSLTLHSGSNYEGLTCSATFHVENGEVRRCAPEVKEIMGISTELMRARMMNMLRR